MVSLYYFGLTIEEKQCYTIVCVKSATYYSESEKCPAYSVYIMHWVCVKVEPSHRFP